MKREIEKLTKGLYIYKNILISYEDEQPDLGWFFIWKDERQYFALRTQAQRQIDRLLQVDASAMAQAPTDAQLAQLDLSLYVDDDLLLNLQRRLSAQGRPYSRRQLEQLAQAGTGPGKRQMLALILAGVLGL